MVWDSDEEEKEDDGDGYGYSNGMSEEQADALAAASAESERPLEGIGASRGDRRQREQAPRAEVSRRALGSV